MTTATKTTVIACDLTWEEITVAVTEGRAFITGLSNERHYITEYTQAGRVTFTENGVRSGQSYGTGRIIIDI